MFNLWFYYVLFLKLITEYKSISSVLLHSCIFWKGFPKTGTRKELNIVRNWSSYRITYHSTWSTKVIITTILRATGIHLTISRHELKTVSLFDSRSSERSIHAPWFEVTSHRFMNVLLWLLGSYVPYRVKKDIKNMKTLEKFEVSWTSYDVLKI